MSKNTHRVVAHTLGALRRPGFVGLLVAAVASLAPVLYPSSKLFQPPPPYRVGAELRDGELRATRHAESRFVITLEYWNRVERGLFFGVLEQRSRRVLHVWDRETGRQVQPDDEQRFRVLMQQELGDRLGLGPELAKKVVETPPGIKVLWLGILGNITLAYVVIALVVAVVRLGVRRSPEGTECSGCGYDIRQLTSSRCPECGQEVDAGA